MSNIDKRALREAAEKADSIGWDGIEYELDVGPRATEFISRCSPAAVLALLDELEAAEKRIADLESREVTLPRPECTYADHSYPAYSERQVVALLESLGIRINRED